MPQRISEAAAAPAVATPGRIKVGLITPGWGSSGYYSAKVVENAAADKVWPAGTQIFFDHPSESELYDRPERSVRDLAAVTTEDARWDGAGLVAEAKVIGPYRELVTDEVFAEAVGMSIRSTAETTTGEAEGRKGTIVTRLVEGVSVDLVTKAGRGGKVLAVLESARAEAREAMAGDIRDALQAAVRDANPGEKVYAFVRDFDPDASLVYYEVEAEADGSALYRQSYKVASDGSASLTGDRVEVVMRTTYVPVDGDTSGDATEAKTVTVHLDALRKAYEQAMQRAERSIREAEASLDVPAPAGQSTATQSEGDDMATTQIEESRLRDLEKDAERVQTLESERDTARTSLAEAHREIDRGRARDVVREAAREANVDLDEYQVAGIAADYPTAEGRLDEDKLAESAKAAVAKLAESYGAGRVRGFGGSDPSGDSATVSEADYDAAFNYEPKGA